MHDSDTAENWRERPGSKVIEFDLCLENRFKSHFYGPTEAKGRLNWKASDPCVNVLKRETTQRKVGRLQ